MRSNRGTTHRHLDGDQAVGPRLTDLATIEERNGCRIGSPRDSKRSSLMRGCEAQQVTANPAGM